MPKDRFNFQPATLPPEAFDYHHLMKMGLSKAEAKQEVQRMKLQQCYLSSVYQVNVQDVLTPEWGITLTWLSIKRRDKAAFHDWRELQGIKNAICGPEREGMELYPAESRLVDTSNQYHLWVLPKGMSFPLGYPQRLVHTESSHGAIQRPFGDQP